MGKFAATCSECGTALIRKMEMSMYFCDIRCKAAWQKRVRPDAAWLRQKYEVEGMSADAIAREVGRDPKRVWEWLRLDGITTRPRGAIDYGNRFKPGQESAFKGHKHTDAMRAAQRAARIADGRIPAYVNGVHWMKHYGRKSPAWKGGISPERQSFYATDEWKAASRAVWARDNARCVKCGIAVGRDCKFAIHHIDSFMIRERRAVVENLVLLCRPCHLWVHSNANVERRFLGEGH